MARGAVTTGDQLLQYQPSDRLHVHAGRAVQCSVVFTIAQRDRYLSAFVRVCVVRVAAIGSHVRVHVCSGALVACVRLLVVHARQYANMRTFVRACVRACVPAKSGQSGSNQLIWNAHMQRVLAGRAQISHVIATRLRRKMRTHTQRRVPSRVSACGAARVVSFCWPGGIGVLRSSLERGLLSPHGHTDRHAPEIIDLCCPP